MSVTLRARAPIAPEANWANMNARPIVALLDPSDVYLCGALPAEAVAPALRRVLRALNVEGDRSAMVFDGYGSGRVTSCGSTDEQARRRLTEAAAVLKYAVENGVGVYWG